jgi:hypothetical protein
VLYADNAPEALQAWAGTLTKDALESVFTPEMIRRHFRVIALGNLLPGQNLEVRPPYVVNFEVEGAPAPRIDTLHRTITVRRPAGGARAAEATARWETYPREVRAAIGGRELAAASATLATDATTELTLTANDGSRATWRVVFVDDGAGEGGRATRE